MSDSEIKSSSLPVFSIIDGLTIYQGLDRFSTSLEEYVIKMTTQSLRRDSPEPPLAVVKMFERIFENIMYSERSNELAGKFPMHADEKPIGRDKLTSSIYLIDQILVDGVAEQFRQSMEPDSEVLQGNVRHILAALHLFKRCGFSFSIAVLKTKLAQLVSAHESLKAGTGVDSKAFYVLVRLSEKEIEMWDKVAEDK